MFDVSSVPRPVTSAHPVDVGLRTEVAIVAELVTRGYRILLPYGFNERFDLALDLGDGRIVRAQCKTGRLRNGVVLFSTRSVRTNSRHYIVRDYHGEADVFMVFCAATDQVYCVPVESAPKREMSLRVDPSRNGQRSGIRLASDFELPA